VSRYQKKKRQRNEYQSQERIFKPEPLIALSRKQALYLRALYNEPQVFAVGSAGSGKTYLAASVAADQLYSEQVSKIIICRPTIGADEEIGYLPGGLNAKMNPWLMPFIDTIEERYGKTTYSRWLNSGAIEIVPLAYMRGRTFKNSWVLLDEAQNISTSQMKMFLTRIGDGSKVVVSGDLQQSDLKKDSGLKTAIDIIRAQGLKVPIIEFTKEDIVRSGVCALWSEAWEKYEGT
jgi:phosphate starvation-inducible PhoH-like protein